VWEKSVFASIVCETGKCVWETSVCARSVSLRGRRVCVSEERVCASRLHGRSVCMWERARDESACGRRLRGRTVLCGTRMCVGEECVHARSVCVCVFV